MVFSYIPCLSRAEFKGVYNHFGYKEGGTQVMPLCQSCGGTVSHHDQVCSYCGTPNAGYQAVTAQVSQLISQAMLAYQRREYEKAIPLFEQGIRLDDQIFEAYFYLADGLKRTGRITEALRAMLAAQTIRPGSSVTYFNAGVLYKQTGNRVEAKRNLAQALELASRDSALSEPKRFIQLVKAELASLEDKPASTR
jgi:tetratricopeptide (TPR) repeat protein